MKVAGKSSAGRSTRRRGSVLPLLAISLTGLIGFLALGIDMGMLVITKAQAQNAADLASLTAARTLTGDVGSNYNQGAATINAQNILTWNAILGQSIQSSQLQLTYGTYDYNQTTQTFNANFPGTAGTPTSAVTATVTANNPKSAFSAIFGFQFLPNVTATATAVHRPRDLALVMDLSGSMRMGTCLGFDFATQTRTTNNPDPLYPTFGPYSSSSAAVQGPSANRTSSVDNYTIPPSNTTVSNASYSLTYVNGFYQNNAYATPLVRAWDSYTSGDGGITWSPPAAGATPQLPPASYATTPGGDVPLYKKNSTTTYAQHVQDIVGGGSRSAAWELDGYSNYTNGVLSNAAVGQSNYQNAPFYGYTQGPGYYGKSFAIWPPDPRRPLTTTNDSATIQQFLKDFGYNNADFSNPVTGPPLQGIYNATKTPGSQTWPWPNDGGTTLSNYLTSNVFIPGGGRLLTTSDSQYQQIMRLYNWNYLLDNLGTTPADWRLRFFGTNDNTKLFQSSGALNTPGTNYTINYNEILRWITATPNPFPQQLRAGRVKYYSSIPTAITGSWPNYGSTDQRFWKEFIDYVLGFYQTGANTYQDVSGMAGLGGDFTWGTPSLHSPPSKTQYMNYTDIPSRGLQRFWFGPTNMVDYMHNYNMEGWVGSPYFWMTPGDSYEAPSYSGKQGFLGAIQTMQSNHPNDWFTTITYSWPRNSANGGFGRFNTVRSPLGPNYAYAQAAMLFPFSTINADGSPNNTEVTPYDADPATGQIPSANFVDTPRGDGDTCFAMALMLAYNQFATTLPADGTLRSYASSAPITFPTGMAGGMGRKGAQKVVIFETDGLANCDATASLVNAGSYKYYQIRYDMNNPNGSEYPAVTTYGDLNDPAVVSHVYSLVQQLATDYGTPRNPFRLYAMGFGPVFQGPDANAALATLQNMQYYAGTQTSPGTPLPASQIITGTDSQMSTNMTTAFTNILENGIQIALIK